MIKLILHNILAFFKSKKFIAFVLLGAILIFAFYLRSASFYISHWQGDECHYLGLAMKLEQFGLDQYSLRGINMRFLNLTKKDDIKLAFPWPAGPKDKGDLLKMLILVGADYYDQPLFFNGPGMPIALIISHKLFAARNQPYTVAINFPNKILNKARLPIISKSQFFAAIVPLFFSLMTMLTIFFLGRYLFKSYRIALYASFIYAINGVNLLTAQKIWADDMLTFFSVLSILLLVISLRKEKLWLALLGGASCGIAILAKQSGLLILPIAWLFVVVINKDKLFKLKSLPSVIFNKYFLLFLLGALIASGFWFYKVFKVYDNPIYYPPRADSLKKDISGWYRMVANRPPAYVLYLVGIPFICPIFLFGYYSIKNFVLELKKLFFKQEFNYAFILLWVWILVFYAASRAIGKEHRYMLPLYPALAILSAYSLDRLREVSFLKKNVWLKEAVPILLLFACAAWSVPIGLNTVLENKLLILKPF